MSGYVVMNHEVMVVDTISRFVSKSNRFYSSQGEDTQ